MQRASPAVPVGPAAAATGASEPSAAAVAAVQAAVVAVVATVAAAAAVAPRVNRAAAAAGGGSFVAANARNASFMAGVEQGYGFVVISANNISGAGTVYFASGLDTTFNPRFEGGTFQLDTVGATYTQNFTLDGSTTNTIDLAGKSATFSGAFSDAVTGTAGNIVVSDSGSGGVATLSGTNTYSGATTITSGTLQLGDGGTTGSIGAAAVTDNGALVLDRSGSATFTNIVSGSGSLTIEGNTSGLDTLSGALTQTGGFTVADASNVTLSGSYNAASTVTTHGGAFTVLGSTSATQDDGLVAAQGGTITVGSASDATASLKGANSAIQGQSAAPLTVHNYGTISGTNYEGITARGTGGATVHNFGTGVITTQGTSESGAWAVGNDQDNGGALDVVNDAGGTIVGAGRGVFGTASGDRVSNAGTIAAGSYDSGTGAVTVGGNYAVLLSAGGAVTNTGTLESGGAGVDDLGGALTLVNTGTIASLGTLGDQKDGVFNDGGATTALNSGTISSQVYSGLVAAAGGRDCQRGGAAR